MMSSSIKRVSIKRQLQQFSVQDKLDAIQRVNEGESKASVARDIGVPESTLRGWCKRLCNGTLDVSKRVRVSEPSTTVPTNITLPAAAVSSTLTAPTTKDPELDDALYYWLRHQQQQVVGMSEQLCQPSKSASSSSAAAVAAAAAAAVAATTGAMVSNATSAAELNPGTGWFWRWYKRYGLEAASAMLGKQVQAPARSPPSALDGGGALPLLTAHRGGSVTPQHRTPAPAHTPQPPVAHTPMSSGTPAPAHLPPPHRPHPQLMHTPVAPVVQQDSEDEEEDDEPPLSAAEAVAHGEKFLRWLDCCSDPSVTALQILQFRYLLNNVRACAARRAKVATNKQLDRL